MQLRKINRILLTTLCLSAGMSVFSLESDKEQDIVYSALGRSTSRIEGDVRIVTLEDNVKVTQGTLEISGDNARFESEADTSAIRQVTVTGSPAQYRQQLDVDGDYVEGESDSIFYYIEGEPVVEFIGSAILRGSNDVLRCASIKYYTDSRFTETTGPCEGVSGRTTSGDSPL
jgi:lipopolysaccharide transport protein LptA